MGVQAFLDFYNITLDEAYSYIVGNINNPKGLFDSLKSVGASTNIIKEIVQYKNPQITVDQVRQFFNQFDLDSHQLDAAYFDLVRKQIPQTFGNTNDAIEGAEDSDYIDGGWGNDFIEGGLGDDILIGSSGSDTLKGGWGADYLEGGLGADELDAGRLSQSYYIPGYYSGKVWIPSQSWTEYDLSSNILMGDGGSDTLKGGYGPDRLDGGDGDDIIVGNEGEDTIFGGGGADRIYVGSYYYSVFEDDGSDLVDAGDGDDSIAAADGYADRVYAGVGNDDIVIDNSDELDAGDGNDAITIRFSSQASRSGIIKAGEGTDFIEVDNIFSSYAVAVDLVETNQRTDEIAWDVGVNHGLIEPMLVIKGFDPKNDQFDIHSFNLVGTSLYAWGSTGDSAALVISWGGTSSLEKNYTQILTSPTQEFIKPISSPKSPDDYGKGFFVITGSAASNADTLTVANFLDSYGNNNTYQKSYKHYFLINIGSSDMALYLFYDDTGADNNVVADELIPIATFIGIRTEDFTMSDLIHAFV